MRPSAIFAPFQQQNGYISRKPQSFKTSRLFMRYLLKYFIVLYDEKNGPGIDKPSKVFQALHTSVQSKRVAMH